MRLPACPLLAATLVCTRTEENTDKRAGRLSRGKKENGKFTNVNSDEMNIDVVIRYGRKQNGREKRRKKSLKSSVLGCRRSRLKNCRENQIIRSDFMVSVF